MERLAEVRLEYSESLEVLSLAVHLPVLEREERYVLTLEVRSFGLVTSRSTVD